MDCIEIGSRLRDRPKTRCGAGAPTLVIASVGTSAKSDSLVDELEKVTLAKKSGAEAVTDHSFYGDIAGFHRQIANNVDVILSTVACYEFAATHQASGWKTVPPRLPLEILNDQLDRGVDLVTIHASLRRKDVLAAKSSRRLIPTTSKGGGIMSSYMRRTGRENPYFEFFATVLSLLKDRDATLSLGTSFRAASVADGWDADMATEIETMGTLARQAQSHGVPVMVEGMGHAAIHSIQTYVRLTKLYTSNAPYRVLPMATDRALGFDHISGAIAAAAAIAAGADAVTAMSRAEHIGLPDQADLEEAIVASKIAAACGELSKIGDFSAEEQMSRTRWANGCKGDWTSAIVPSLAEEALRDRGRLDDQLIQCGMCGDFCGIASGIATVRLSGSRPKRHD